MLAATLDALVGGARLIRDVDAAVADVLRRAGGLCAETNWRAPSAERFRAGVRTWTEDLAGVRGRLLDLDADLSAAASRVDLIAGTG